jgi:calcium-dependent protein kinase
LWSMGVVTFVMVFGYPPFHAESDSRILQLVRKGFTPVTAPGWGAHFPQSLPVSKGAKDFIAKLLTPDVAARMTAEEALSHPWLKGEAAAVTDLDPLVLAGLRTFTARPKLKAAVLSLMVDSLNELEVETLRVTAPSHSTDSLLPLIVCIALASLLCSARSFKWMRTRTASSHHRN